MGGREKMSGGEGMNLSQFARFVGRDRKTIRTAATDGRIQAWKKIDGQFIFDPEKAREEYLGNSRAYMVPEPGQASLFGESSEPSTPAIFQDQEENQDSDSDDNHEEENSDSVPEQPQGMIVHDGMEIPEYSVSRAIREHYSAIEARINAEKKAGSLVNLEDVKKLISSEYGTAINILLNLPDRITDLIASQFEIDDTKELYRIIDEDVQKIVRVLSDAIRD